jgi:hypothetical protein
LGQAGKFLFFFSRLFESIRRLTEPAETRNQRQTNWLPKEAGAMRNAGLTLFPILPRRTLDFLKIAGQMGGHQGLYLQLGLGFIRPVPLTDPDENPILIPLHDFSCDAAG